MQGSMRLMIRTDDIQFLVTCNAAPKVADRKTNAQKIDGQSGLPMWTTELTALGAKGASVIQVTTVSTTAPAVSMGETVVPMDLEALPWSNKDRDGEVRTGIAFRASALQSLTPAAV